MGLKSGCEAVEGCCWRAGNFPRFSQESRVESKYANQPRRFGIECPLLKENTRDGAGKSGSRKLPGRRPMTLPLRLAVLLLAAAALLSACGGGGSGGGLTRTGTNTGTTIVSRCIQTQIFGCLAPEQFARQVDTLATNHSQKDNFKNQWGLSTTRADRAYAQLELKFGAGTAPGSGQTVGVIDTGIDTGHPVFAGKTLTEEFLSGATDEIGDEPSHGTAVAGVIAGRPSDTHTADVDAARGVAWGADIAMFAIPLGTGGGTYRPVLLTTLASDDDDFKAVIDTVLAWSSGTRTLDFVNMSFGWNGIVDLYSTQQLRSNYSDSIAALAQTGVTEKTVFVWAAGNAHGDPCDPADFTGNADLCESYIDAGETKYRVNAKSVEILPGLPVLIPELRGHVVAVVAIGPDGSIASFSNRCGSAAQWCVAAPGQQIRTAYFGPNPDTNEAGVRGAWSPSGTSFATPMVTGALVVMKHYFRDQLSMLGLVSRLLATADKNGIYADNTIYGHGLLDLAAATSPVGQTSIALGDRVGGPGANAVQTRFTAGSALGNGPTLALAGQEVAAFDELGAPFWYNLGGFARAAPGPSGLARLRAFMAWPAADREGAMTRTGRRLLGGFAPAGRNAWPGGLRLGFLDPPSVSLRGGHLGLARRALALDMRAGAVESGAGESAGFGITAFSTEGRRGQAPVSGALLSWQPAERPFSLRAGLIGERETLLGSRSAGAFGRLSTGSAFVGFEGGVRVGAWRLDASAELGIAHGTTGSGLIAGVSPLHSSAFAVRAVAEVLALAAAARRVGPCQTLGSGRPHPGWPGAAPDARGRSCADRPADRHRRAMASAP